MKPPSGRSEKPSQTHIVWIEGEGDPEESRRFHEGELRRWAARYTREYETLTRIDRERGDEPREQYRCTFDWKEGESESFSMDEKSWSIGADRVPVSFFEIDAAGQARVSECGTDYVLDVAELAHHGPRLMFREVGVEAPFFLDARHLVGA
jgi:hypothetical protein